MIRRQRAATIPVNKPIRLSETQPLHQKIGGQGSSQNYKKKETSMCGPILLFIGLLIFAFGGTWIIIALTEHQTQLPDGHSLFDDVGLKIGSAEETSKRISRMERNIVSTKSTTLSTEAKEENPNLLDMSKKPNELYAPVQHDDYFDNWFWGGNDNKNKDESLWKIDENENADYQNLLKELFPNFYMDKETDEKKDDSSKKDQEKTQKEIPSPQKELKTPILNQQDNSQEKSNTAYNQRETNTQPIYGQPKPIITNQQNSNINQQNSYNQQESNAKYNNQQNYQANPNAPPNYYSQQQQQQKPNTPPRNTFNQQNYNQEKDNGQNTNNQPQGDSQARNYNQQQQQQPNYNHQQQQQQPNYNQQQQQQQPNYNQQYQQQQQPNYNQQ
jgi:hypothetical protein